MNEQNYGSREACQRLVDAGIVLETETYWTKDDGDLKISHFSYISIDRRFAIPAPSPAEVWRELWGSITGYLRIGYFGDSTFIEVPFTGPEYQNTNLTDALIDLLIWVKRRSHDRQTMEGSP